MSSSCQVKQAIGRGFDYLLRGTFEIYSPNLELRKNNIFINEEDRRAVFHDFVP